MTRKTLLYIPIVLLFAFAIAALFSHYSDIGEIQGRALREAKLPFGYLNGRAFAVKPDAEKAGIKTGDRIERINGRELDAKDVVFDEELTNMRGGTPIVLTMSRAIPEGGRETFEATVIPIGIEKSFTFYTGFVGGFIFVYVLPTLCILLGFWVLFVRPADPLAWILLFVLLGLSALSLEMHWDGTTITGAYQKIFFAGWALAMLLFGIYFPERWVWDEKLPWLKWLLIVLLSFQMLLTLFGLLRVNTGIDLFRFIAPLANAYGVFGFFVNMLAIGLFFAALGYKSGTTQNPDAKRRLRVMLYGTSLAITPSFLLVIYRIITQKEGSFFEIVPFWIGLTALLLMLLFPLTMAYVIVVYRAMDVSVVVRQGLQYALARNGVRVLQLGLLLLLIIGLIWIFRNFEGDIAAQVGFVAAGFALNTADRIRCETSSCMDRPQIFPRGIQCRTDTYGTKRRRSHYGRDKTAARNGRSQNKRIASCSAGSPFIKKRRQFCSCLRSGF